MNEVVTCALVLIKIDVALLASHRKHTQYIDCVVGHLLSFIIQLRLIYFNEKSFVSCRFEYSFLWQRMFIQN